MRIAGTMHLPSHVNHRRRFTRLRSAASVPNSLTVVVVDFKNTSEICSVENDDRPNVPLRASHRLYMKGSCS